MHFPVHASTDYGSIHHVVPPPLLISSLLYLHPKPLIYSRLCIRMTSFHTQLHSVKLWRVFGQSASEEMAVGQAYQCNANLRMSMFNSPVTSKQKKNDRVFCCVNSISNPAWFSAKAISLTVNVFLTSHFHATIPFHVLGSGRGQCHRANARRKLFYPNFLRKSAVSADHHSKI